MIPGYPKGSDITLLEIIYTRPQRMEDGKYTDDILTIIFRDNLVKKKFHHDIIKPTYKFYMLKPHISLDYNAMYINKEFLDEYECRYTELDKTIAELTDNLDIFYDNIRNGNRAANSILHTNNRLFGTDEDLEDHYRRRFAEEYLNQPYVLAKSMIDIEVDVKDMNPADNISEHMGDYPITAVTIIDDKNKKVYTAILRNKENPLIQELEDYINSGDGFQKDIRELLESVVGGWKNVKRYGLDQYDFEQYFYDIEIELIADLFVIINNTQPDFILAWNMAFDIPYLFERIKKLGYNVEDIVCHPDFKQNKVAYYNIDEYHQKGDFDLKGDYAKVSGYTVYIDQLIQYASRRKGQQKPPNFRLDTIGNIVAKVRKLDYSHITNDLSMLPYIDFKTYILYNIIDTIVQKCIEMKTEDLNYVFTKALLNNIRYAKLHRNTIYLTNRGRAMFKKDHDLIMGNNINKFKDKPEGKFKGAIVGDPRHIDTSVLMHVDGKPVYVCENVNDFDFSSMYPSITEEFNISGPTMIGKINIPGEVLFKENSLNSEFYIREGQFIEDFHSGDFLLFCHRWFGFANFKELLEDIKEYFSLISTTNNWVNWNFAKKINPIEMISEGQKFSPIVMIDKNEKFNPVVLYHDFKSEEFTDNIKELENNEVTYLKYKTN